MRNNINNPNNTQLTKSVEKVLNAYIEGKIEPFFDNILTEYQNRNNLQKAMKLLYITTNYSSHNFEAVVADKLSDPSFKILVSKLRTISQLCNGAIKEGDVFFREHRELIATEILSNQNLKSEVGQYFKNRSNIYLQEKYPIMYGLVDEELKKDQSQSPSR